MMSAEINQECIAMLPSKAYERMTDLLEHPDPSNAWIEEFNATAIALENRDDTDIDNCLPAREDGMPTREDDDGGLPTRNHGLPWIAFFNKNDELFIASPPFIIGNRKSYGAFRLAIDAMHPADFKGGTSHLHADEYLLDKANYPAISIGRVCLHIGAPTTLVSIFACWDFVAREGFEISRKAGIITKGWIDVVKKKLPCNGLPKTQLASHNMMMFNISADQCDVENGLLYYMLLREIKHDSVVSKFLIHNNKFEILAMKRGIIENDEYYEKLIPWLDLMPASWMFDGKNFGKMRAYEMFMKAERESYPNYKEMWLARSIRDGTAVISNSEYNVHEVPCLLAAKTGILPRYFRKLEEPMSNRRKMRSILEKTLPSIGRNLNSFNGLYYVDIYETLTRGVESHNMIIVDVLEWSFICIKYEYTSPNRAENKHEGMVKIREISCQV